jgi:hypothetical protein
MRMRVSAPVLAALFVWVALAPPAHADKNNFDLSAKLYTKWLYRNDDSQGVLWLGNPFWPDDIAGNNGVATEFELTMTGNVSKWVKAGAVLKSRFGGTWHDWWESGERKFEYLGEHNTSGDSLGMNRAQYVKFRGFYIDLNPNLPFIDWARVGASDLSMFNPWTIGKIRYIDRHNARGVFLQGGFDSGILRYHTGIIALPKLWVGPGWSTGIGDDFLEYPFVTQDWAYGARLDSEPLDWMKVSLISTLTRDVEFDKWDPDATGSTNGGCVDTMGGEIPGCVQDHAVSTYPRYENSVSTLEVEMMPGDVFYAHLLAGYSYSGIGEDFAANGVADNGGMFPLVYGDVHGYSGRGRFFVVDPFEVGLSFKLEGFYISEDWTSIFGARREADVLLTDGFIEGGQLPTLNLANEFIDFDEPFFESCIGWMGGTALLEYQGDNLELSAEGTYLTYDTNGQGRDVDKTYPTFLYSEGYTDTDLFDYANIGDRGRDPRSVYKRDQDRQTVISMLKGSYTFDFGLRLQAKVKYIMDDDWRKLTYDNSSKYFTDDDYLGHIITGRLQASMAVLPYLTLGLGGQVDYWDEANRSGDLAGGYGDYVTQKQKGFAFLSYRWGGASLNYYMEYLHKDQDRPAELGLEDQLWKVWRAKAFLEVAW